MINYYHATTITPAWENSGTIESGVPLSDGTSPGCAYGYFDNAGNFIPQNTCDGHGGQLLWQTLDSQPPGTERMAILTSQPAYTDPNSVEPYDFWFDNKNPSITSITTSPAQLTAGSSVTFSVSATPYLTVTEPYSIVGSGFCSSINLSGTVTFNDVYQAAVNVTLATVTIPSPTSSSQTGSITVTVAYYTQTFTVPNPLPAPASCTCQSYVAPPCTCQSYVAPPACSCQSYVAPACTCDCNYETSTRGPSCTVVGNDCILYRLAFLGSNGTWYALTSSTNNQHPTNYGTISWGLLPYTQTNDIVTITIPSGVSITKICDIESVSGQSTADDVFELDIIIPGVGSYVYKGSGVLSPISIVPQSGSFQIYVLGWINYCSGNACTTDWFYFTPTPDWTDSPLLPGTVVKAQHVTELQNQINLEYKRRSKPTYSFPSLGSIVKYSDVYQLYNAISQISTSLQWHENFATPLTGQVIKAVNIEDLRDNINYLQTQCVCNCNYCTCQCNYACTCNCNYACTCNCNYACTCVCNYCSCQSYVAPPACSCQSYIAPPPPSCSCQSYVASPPCSCQSYVAPCSCQSYVAPPTCTCDCNYCTCNCNYCTCNCNYCTCDCNHACVCDCNYACTCVCNYACTCNCAYCPCACNYCTCNCAYGCTCDCNYVSYCAGCCSCFLAGTPVLAYDPQSKQAFWKLVETFEVGDYVISADKGIPVRIKKIDKPVLADRKIYGFTDGSLKWSSEHPFWTIDNSGKEWWWTVDPAIWRREIDLGETVGLKDNYSIRSGKDFKFATLNGFETKDFKMFEGYDPVTPLYFPVAENGVPIIVAGYVSTGGTDEFSYGDYSTFKWDPEAVKKWLK